jgi:EAL and modified HD-GYP domain-containing signal transduction protein
MSDKIYIARQPIIDANNEIYAYELLFRMRDDDGEIKTLFDDDLLATAKVLVNALNHFGIKSLVNDSYAFLNIDQEFLMDQLIYAIPQEKFVLEILETTIINDVVIDKIKKLKELGYRFALDDVLNCSEFISKFEPIFPYLDIIKLDVLLNDNKVDEKNLEIFRKYNIKLLAEKVETREQYETFKSYGCELFQGYYFAKPDVVVKKSLDPAYKKIFQLINLLDSDDVDVKDIVKEFESEVELSIQLLRFMNSCYIGLKKEVKSMMQVVTLLGKKPLRQWLLLIAFSKSMGLDERKIKKNPVFDLAITRSRLMAEIAMRCKKGCADKYEASFVGILSLIDIMLQMPMEKIFEEIQINEDVQGALLKHTGELGKILKLVMAIEKFDLPQAEKILEEIKISNEEFSHILQKGYERD